MKELSLVQAIEQLELEYKVAKKSFDEFAYRSKELIEQLIKHIDANDTNKVNPT